VATPALTWWMLWPSLAFGAFVALALVRGGRRGRVPHRLLQTGAIAATVLAVVPVLRADAIPLERQPFSDSQQYADAASQLAHGNGYVTDVYVPPEKLGRDPPPPGTLRPPLHPPGYAVALAPFAVAGSHPDNVQLGAKLLAAFYVVVAASAAWSLGGALAAGVAASLVAAAPFGTTYGTFILSDAFGAALLVITVVLVQRPTRTRAALAGAAAGISTVVRLISGVVIPLLLVVLPAGRRLRAILFAAPFIVALALSQWSSYGSPHRTGYTYWDPDLRLFDPRYAWALERDGDAPGVVQDVLHGDLLEWACPCSPGGPQEELPNLVFYPAVLLGLFWIFTPPLLTVPGAIYAWRHRREPAAALTLLVAAVMLAYFVFFYYRAARFLAGPATLLAIWTAVAVGRWLAARFPEPGSATYQADQPPSTTTLEPVT
jgi:hypothetical protein